MFIKNIHLSTKEDEPKPDLSGELTEVKIFLMVSLASLNSRQISRDRLVGVHRTK